MEITDNRTMAAEIVIRQGGVEDATQIAQLLHDFNEEYDDPTPEVPVLAKRVRELLEQEAIAVLLAGDPPGGLTLTRFRPSIWSVGLDAYLEEFYVVPGQRGEGIGRALLETTMAAARKAGATHIDLCTGETDTAARALYESCGFTNREGAPDGPKMLYYECELD